MLDLKSRLRATAQYEGLRESLKPGHASGVGGLWGASCALFAAALADEMPSCVLVICSKSEDAEAFAEDVDIFSPDSAMFFPARQWLTSEEVVIDQDVIARQVEVLRYLSKSSREKKSETAAQDSGDVKVIVAPAPALIQPVVNPEELDRSSWIINKGDEIEPQELSEWLVSRDFEHVPMVEMPGEFSIRGGIIDVYPLSADWPFRIELGFDGIDSIRSFEPSTQRSREQVTSFTISSLSRRQLTDATPNAAAGQSEAAASSLAHYLPDDAVVLFNEPVEVQERAERERRQLDDPSLAFDYVEVCKHLSAHPMVFLTSLPASLTDERFDYRSQSTQRFQRETHAIVEELDRIAARHEHVCIFCDNDAEESRLTEILKATPLEGSRRIEYCRGYLSSGFLLPEVAVACVGNHEIFNRYQQRRVVRRRSEPIESFVELQQGDFVVHLAQGIARFRGLERLSKDGREQEFLKLEFAERSFVYVPASKADLVQRYVGTFKARPKLSKLGGKRWNIQKDKAKKAVEDFASELMDRQAMREELPGFACPPYNDWQVEFEGSFLYKETEDQLEAMAQIRDDMQSSRPMDRLLCGDVGYGKTELAMRAAFKAVGAGRQVAVLVPTTVLAQQHFNTFSERMADYPINIALLSRFRTRSEQMRSIESAARGRTDIVIGTHRLLSKDVYFKNLGLIIIDEEQRFGVAHKEQLKKLREMADVLTMTATPIPRTLHMSLLGIKEISSLNTPPQDRVSIHTEVCRFDKQRVREAILRELRRDGQVFFVHNRVHHDGRIKSIDAMCEELRELVPEVRFAVAHGQMKERELERSMTKFIEHEADVLVSTTIIESGLDIPNANTIIVSESNLYGLADMHQLRGRVGRYKHRAYAYFLLPRGKPLSRQSLRRLKSIEDYSELGAGFKIAMRDLEIRGAGNILGVEQSGHIAAVGYDLYCRLLEASVRQMRNEPVPPYYDVDIDIPVPAFLSSDYVPGTRQRIQLYRRLALCQEIETVRELTAEMIDRFGPPGEPAKNIIDLHELRITLGMADVTYISLRGDYALARFENIGRVNEVLSGTCDTVRMIDDNTLHLHPERKIKHDSQWIWHLKRVFGGDHA